MNRFSTFQLLVLGVLSLAGPAGFFGPVTAMPAAPASGHALEVGGEVVRVPAAPGTQRQDDAPGSAEALDRALTVQAQFLAHSSNRSTRDGDAGTGLLLALEALPREGGAHPDRPLVEDAVDALFSAVCSLRERGPLWGHLDPIMSATYSPDGDRILTRASGGPNAPGVAMLWNAEGERLAILIGHRKEVTDVSFSPDGKLLVTASRDGTARIWTEEGETVATLEGHTGDVLSCTVSPGGKLILTSSADGTARLWDITGKEVAVLAGHEGPIPCASFSRAGDRIVTGSADRTARVWSAAGVGLFSLEGHATGIVSAGFSPVGEGILTASSDGTAMLWKAEGERRHVLKARDRRLDHAEFSPDGSRVLTVSVSGVGRIWDMEGSEVATLTPSPDQRRRGPRSHGTFSPDGKHVALTDGIDLRLWRISPGGWPRQEAVLGGHRYPIHHAAFRPDSAELVTCSDGSARRWSRSRIIPTFAVTGPNGDTFIGMPKLDVLIEYAIRAAPRPLAPEQRKAHYMDGVERAPSPFEDPPRFFFLRDR